MPFRAFYFPIPPSSWIIKKWSGTKPSKGMVSCDDSLPRQNDRVIPEAPPFLSGRSMAFSKVPT